jgi:spore germination protein KB
MEKTRGKIGIREFIAVVILTIGTKMTDDTPAILYEQVENSAWMAPLIIGALSIIPIYLLTKVVLSHREKDLIEVVTHLVGKPIGFILLLILWIIVSVAITVDSSIYTDIIGTMYFTKTPTLVIYAILMGTCAYGAKKDLEQIGSFAWAVLFWIKASLFAALILTFTKGKIAFIFPLFGEGGWEVIKESTSHLSIYTDFIFLALLAPFVAGENAYKKGIWLALAIITIELSIALFAFLVLFDYEPVKMLNYPYHETIRYVSLEFLPNIEAIFFPFWLLATFVRFSFYLYLNAILFGGIFKIKNFKYLIPTLATLIVFLGMIPETPTFTFVEFRQVFLKILTPIYFLLPCVFWIIAKARGDFRT